MRENTLGDSLIWIAKRAVVIGFIVWGLRVTVLDLYLIPSASMEPSLMAGDIVAVSKSAYGTKLPFTNAHVFADMPRRGDVAVFKLPSDVSKFYIKRVVGLSGDRVQIRQGRVYLNGEQLIRRPVEDFALFGSMESSVKVPQYVEVAPDGKTSYRIIEAHGDHGARDATEEYLVPQSHVFVLGDNRDNSVDSRVFQPPFQFVPLSLIVGKAIAAF